MTAHNRSDNHSIPIDAHKKTVKKIHSAYYYGPCRDELRPISPAYRIMYLNEKTWIPVHNFLHDFQEKNKKRRKEKKL